MSSHDDLKEELATGSSAYLGVVAELWLAAVTGCVAETRWRNSQPSSHWTSLHVWC